MFNTRLGKLLGKMKLRWSGPFWIHSGCGLTSYFLAMLKGELLIVPINGFWLRHYYTQEILTCPFIILEDMGVDLMMVNLCGDLLQDVDVQGCCVVATGCNKGVDDGAHFLVQKGYFAILGLKVPHLTKDSLSLFLPIFAREDFLLV